MALFGTFPFGQPIKEVIQKDRTHKKVFILGVYASAVHARWINTNNKTIVKALAVASEPYIFWRGDKSEEIIEQIYIPPSLGKLIPANKQFNGPSGIALDDFILKPLGIDRDDTWLCDLVPHSCMNSNQKKAITRAYLPKVSKFNLPIPSVPEVPQQLTDEIRRYAINDELIDSGAEILILLGDKPIEWFLRYFDDRWNNLDGFIQDGQKYGELQKVKIGSKKFNVLPLTHPRQIDRLGQFSKKWFELHQDWIKKDSQELFGTR